MRLRTCPECRESVAEVELTPNDRYRLLKLSLEDRHNMVRAELLALGLEEAEVASWLEHCESCCGSGFFDASDREVLAAIDLAFGGVQRPQHFTDHEHCPECADHDATLLARPRERLRRRDLGTSGWDPITFTSVQGVAYLMPALAKYSLAEGAGVHGWYGDQLAWHLFLPRISESPLSSMQ